MLFYDHTFTNHVGIITKGHLLRKRIVASTYLNFSRQVNLFLLVLTKNHMTKT